MLWVIFSLSFVVALSGAMAPGPLLTYTIVKSLRARRRGFLVGGWVIGGHALLESLVVVGLLLGLSVLFRNPLTTRVIGTLGGGFLVAMGIVIVRNVLTARLPESEGTREPPFVRSHPLLGGVLVSMSNPYWWIWWATVGFAFMARYDISFRSWGPLLAFFLGHEAGDLAWYLTVSTAVSLGRRHIGPRVYGVLLLACGLLVVAFGLYLGVSPFLRAT